MRYLLICIFCSLSIMLSAFDLGSEPIAPDKEKALAYKQNCARGIKQTDLDVNNVKARLLLGGDFGWDGRQARYVVPNLGPGEPEVSSIFAGGIWLGGVDPAGNLKLAAQTYGLGSGREDFWPGPLTEEGATDAETCENWDRFFTVTSEDIDLHLMQYWNSQKENATYNIADIPKAIKEWPGLGNEFFFEQFGFHLPTVPQGLAPFRDLNEDGIYSPQFGDYPVFSMRGCGSYRYADQMTYWIINDAGNIHTHTGGEAMQMEVQAQSFAFATDDPLNDMTFTHYKMVNRAPESINDTYFGLWLDPDLGCHVDDYIGCDTLRNLMYVYNSDALDGDADGSCPNGVPNYGDKIPYFGVDIFKGLLAQKVIGDNGELMNPALGQAADTIVEIGMTSFIYNNVSLFYEGSSTIAPNSALEYYNYLCGIWRTGEPMTRGGNGFGGTVITKFAFHDEPNDEDGWSLCSTSLPSDQRSAIQSSGPFKLEPGQFNELIIGIPWVPDVAYPCPDMSRLFAADDFAQDLFDNCLIGLGFSNPTSTVEPEKEELDQIIVYPNPSSLSNTSNQNISNQVLICNLPSQSDVVIYTLDGKLVKQFPMQEDPQITSLEWDLRSESGAAVSSGLYLIHIQAEGVGQRVLKLSVLN